MSWKDRFWKKVDKSGGEDACWPWTGAKTREGYGRFCINQTQVLLAHRVARGYLEPTPGKKVHHTCGNPACCNPAHLRLCKIKYPDRKGERAPSAHLTEKEVLEIRRAYEEDGVSFKELSTRYVVKERSIRDIVKRRTWKHI
jgi:hypothetical protein